MGNTVMIKQTNTESNGFQNRNPCRSFRHGLRFWPPSVGERQSESTSDTGCEPLQIIDLRWLPTCSALSRSDFLVANAQAMPSIGIFFGIGNEAAASRILQSLVFVMVKCVAAQQSSGLHDCVPRLQRVFGRKFIATPTSQKLPLNQFASWCWFSRWQDDDDN